MKKMRMKFSVKVLPVLVLSIMLVGFCVTANAAPLTIANYSFEDITPLNNSNPLGNWGMNVPLWNQGAGSSVGIWAPIADGIAFATDANWDGNQVAWSNGGDIWQNTGWQMFNGNTFTLSVDVGNRLDYALPTAPAHEIQLRVGNDILARGSLSSPRSGYFDTLTVSYVVDNDNYNGQDVSIYLVNSGGAQAVWDNVRMTNDPTNGLTTAPVPEPSTLLLLGGGLIGFVGLRRKFKA